MVDPTPSSWPSHHSSSAVCAEVLAAPSFPTSAAGRSPLTHWRASSPRCVRRQGPLPAWTRSIRGSSTTKLSASATSCSLSRGRLPSMWGGSIFSAPISQNMRDLASAARSWASTASIPLLVLRASPSRWRRPWCLVRTRAVRGHPTNISCLSI